MNNKRHVHGCVIDEKAVSFFAVFSEAFAMIAAEHDDGVLVDSFFFQEAQDAAELLVGKGDLAIIGWAAYSVA